MLYITVDETSFTLLHQIPMRDPKLLHLGHNQHGYLAALKSEYLVSLLDTSWTAADKVSSSKHSPGGNTKWCEKLAVGASSKIFHLRLAIAAADEVVFWQTVLLRHFVLFAHQLAVPGDEAERQAACSTGTRRRNHIPAHDKVILVHNNKLSLPLPPPTARYGETTIPHQLQPIYATICYIWRCALEGKVRHTTTRTSTISRPQLVLRHTHSNRHAHIHTHTLKDNWMLTHADAWNRAARHGKKKKNTYIIALWLIQRSSSLHCH